MKKQDKVELLKTHGVPRSDQWEGVRKAWLKEHDSCAACGAKDKKDKKKSILQVHHVVAFHTHPEKELDPTNFITLCEGMERNCHRFIGHLDNFQSINQNSREDAATWLNKIQTRPTWNKKTNQWES